MRGFTLVALGLVIAALVLAPAGSAIRHDAQCRPPGQTGTDAPDSWMFADQLGSFNCVGEMHPTSGGPFPDDRDWFWVPVPAGSNARLTVTICPIFVFVSPWNPNLNLHFLPAAGAVPQGIAQIGQGTHYFQPVLVQVPHPMPIGGSANGSGCDSVNAGAPAGLTSGAGRYYIEVQRGAGGGGYSFAASLA